MLEKVDKNARLAAWGRSGRVEPLRRADPGFREDRQQERPERRQIEGIEGERRTLKAYFQEISEPKLTPPAHFAQADGREGTDWQRKTGGQWKEQLQGVLI